MNELQIASALYKNKKMYVYTTDGKTSMSTGTRLGEGMGLSKKGKKEYDKTKSYRCTISSVAVLFNLLFVDSKRVCAYNLKDTDITIVQIDDAIFSFQNDTIRIITMPKNYYLFVVADALYGLAREKDADMLNAFNDIKQKALLKSSYGEEEIGVFCDAYYQWRKPKIKLQYDDSLVMEEINTAARNTVCQLIPPLNGIKNLAEPSFSIKKEETKKSTTSNLYDKKELIKDCMDGKYTVDYPWDEKQKQFVKSKDILNGYIPSETFFKILRKIKYRTNKLLSRWDGSDVFQTVDIIGEDYINITLVGKPGTGKTETVNAISAATGMPIYITSGSHNTDEDEFDGMTKMIDGVPTSVPTDALTCYEHGGIFLLEEANLIAPAVLMGGLGQAMEPPFTLKKYGYETIHRHPLCICITTINTGTVGSKPMSQAFSNRFKHTYSMNDPEEEVFINVLKNHGASEKCAKWIYNAYTTIIKFIKENNPMADTDSILLSLSMRSCIGALENMEEGDSAKEAIVTSMINKIMEQDMDVAENCMSILDIMPDFKE